MKVVLSCLLLFLAAVAQALSATGDRLLTIWEDVEENQLYSKFLGDLESMCSLVSLVFSASIANRLPSCPGRGYKISHATPKDAELKLSHLGEKTYDHIIFFPIKSKGKIRHSFPYEMGASLKTDSALV